MTTMRIAALMLVIGVVLLLPLLLAEFPPLGDYPNHMARAWILLNRGQSPFFQSLVDLNPHLVPNLGFEALVLPLARALPFMTAGRVAIGIILICHLLACVLLARTVAPGNSWIGLVVGLMGIHGGLQAGFLSFSLGVAWSLATLACWMRWDRGDGPRWGMSVAVLGLTGSVVHATVPVTIVAAVGAVIGMSFLRRKRDFIASCARLLPVVPAALGFLLLRQSAEPGVGDALRWNTLSGKLAALMTWSRTYDLTFDIVWLSGFATLVVAVAYHTRLRGIDRDLLSASGALWLMALAMPLAVMTGSGADARFVPPAATILLIALAPLIQKAGGVAVTAGLVLVVVRQGAIAERWMDLSDQTIRVVELLTIPPPNSLLLQCHPEQGSGIDDAKNAMPFRHVGQYVTVSGDGIARSLFGFTTQQPIVVDQGRLDRAAQATDGACIKPTWPWILREKTDITSPFHAGYSLRAEADRWQLWERNEQSRPRE